MDVTSNVVGLIAEGTGDVGAIAGVPSSAATLGECNLAFYAQRHFALCKKRACGFERKQWCIDIVMNRGQLAGNGTPVTPGNDGTVR